MTRQPSERTFIFLIGAVQFVNILDFVMVLPLGPFFAGPLGIAPSRIGFIGASYTAAAAISGIACSFFLDRFDRRKALAVAVAGLVVATALGGLSAGFGSLISARVLAGLFGGPATSSPATARTARGRGSSGCSRVPSCSSARSPRSL